MGERSFYYYNAGRLQGDAHDLFMFTCWNADHTGCGCHSVYAPDLKANIAALVEGGSIDRTARGEYWDFARRDWVKTAVAA